jgi:hypothetical protein
LVEWKLVRGNTATPWETAVDFRHTQPPPPAFWEIYGAGTYQNNPAFEHHTYLNMPGRYLFRLHIHPDRRSPGTYRLVIRASDIRGNQSIAWRVLRIVH